VEVVYCDNCGGKITPETSDGSEVRLEHGRVYCCKCAPLFKYTTTSLLAVQSPSAKKSSKGLKAVPVLDPLKPARKSSQRLKAVQVPEQQMTADYPAVKSPSKFFFCETCGRRISDLEIENGSGRDKQAKGYYCKVCADGVMTVGFDAVRLAPEQRPTGPQLAVAPKKAASSCSLTPYAPIVPKMGSGIRNAVPVHAASTHHDKPGPKLQSQKAAPLEQAIMAAAVGGAFVMIIVVGILMLSRH
jgi:DNA-directed RNA polymerase subunit M/transcription elongation factor TFIIS